MRYIGGIAWVFVALLPACLAAPIYGQASARPFDARAIDAQIADLLDAGTDADLLAADSLYLLLLSQMGTVPEDDAVLGRRLAQLALILPQAVQARLADGDLRHDPAHATFKAGAAEALLTWWRAQDPLPATPKNERLQEHLRRVAFAEAAYGYARRGTGLDDRGEVYVRYGSPTRQKEITFTDPKLIDTVFQPGLTISPSDFPANAFWIYRHIDGTGYYLFVEKDGFFQLAETIDLLPRILQTGFGSSVRGQIRAEMALAVLRSVYQQLALEHPDFGARYNDVDQYALLQEEAVIQRRLGALARQARNRDQAASRTDRGRDVAAQEDFGGPASLPNPNDLTPYDFVQSVLYQGRSEDAQALWRRETTMPQHYTEVFRETQVLPVAVRTARFLDDDGTTRTEIYWGAAPGGLRFQPEKKDRQQLAQWSTEQFVVALTAVQQTADFRERQVSQRPYLITDLPPSREAAIPAQTMTVRGDTGVYNLALQWDQYLARYSEAEGVRLGPQVKVATHHADSLTALEASPAVLEMSDLKPVFVSDPAQMFGGEVRDGAAGEPYPYPDVWPELPLGIYFEVYHLAFGKDDQTHFRVSYEMVRNKDRSPLLRFLGRRRGRLDGISASIPYKEPNRTAREYILLDFSEWEGTGQLEVRVRVTDETTGQEVARSMIFEMNP